MASGTVDETRRTGASQRIGTKLVKRLLAVVLLPLLALGGVALFAVRSIATDTGSSVESARGSLADSVVAGSLADDADRLIADIENFVGERLSEASLLGEHPDLVAGAIAGGELAESEGLANLDPETLEQRFAETRSLAASPEAEELFVHRIEDSTTISAYHLTDRAGHTVAASGVSSQFFLGNDDNWAQAAAGEFGVSPIAFDAASNRFTIDVDVPVRGADHEVVGVLRSSIDVSYLQDLANSLAIKPGVEVSVLTGEGLLLAETATGHDLTRIMNAELDLDPVVDAEVLAVQAQPQSTGSTRTDESVVGFARSTSSAVGTALGLVVVVAQDESAALAPLAGLDVLHDDVDGASAQLTFILLAILVVAAVAAALVARVLVRNIVHPIEVLRDHANQVATVELPRIVAEVDRLEAGAPLPRLTPADINTGDEVEELAEAFASVQDTAVRLAAEQAAARRRNVASAFISMGRRNQNLIGRQLKFIEELEQNESDPQTLANLFKLDHLATRLRRNAESLLVLAGEEPPRRWGHAVSIVDVVRSAAAEIEQFDRVELSRLDDQPIQGAVVSEMAHLLAELIENALVFSPPQSRVLVAGRVRNETYELAIVDHGIGMTSDEMDVANELLANPVDFDQAPSQRVGLFVVSRLAQRHGIRVRLLPSTSGEGVTALMLIPAALLAKPSDPTRGALDRHTEPSAPAQLAPAVPVSTLDRPAAPAAEPSPDEPAAQNRWSPAVASGEELERPLVHESDSEQSARIEPPSFEPLAPSAWQPPGTEEHEPRFTSPAVPEPLERAATTQPAVPAGEPASQGVPPLPRRIGAGLEPEPTSPATWSPLPRRDGADASFEPPSPTPAEPWNAPAPLSEPAPTPVTGAPPVESGPSDAGRPALPLRTPGGDTPADVIVTPSGLRRRQPTTDRGMLVPGTPQRSQGEHNRDPDEVRATLRRFMTGVGHGRRLAVEGEQSPEIDAVTHRGGAGDE